MKEAYSDGENASQVFEIKLKLWLVKQDNRDPSEYFLKKILCGKNLIRLLLRNGQV